MAKIRLSRIKISAFKISSYAGPSVVVSSMLCVIQVIESQLNMALYTIVLLEHDG